MKTFQIYQGADGVIETVKKGLCWPAAMFGCLWAFSKRCWRVGGGIIAGATVLGIFTALLVPLDEPLIRFLIQVVALAIMGVGGDVWRGKELMIKVIGWKLRSTPTVPTKRGLATSFSGLEKAKRS